jgi:hypothetical protein
MIACALFSEMPNVFSFLSSQIEFLSLLVAAAKTSIPDKANEAAATAVLLSHWRRSMQVCMVPDPQFKIYRQFLTAKCQDEQAADDPVFLNSVCDFESGTINSFVFFTQHNFFPSIFE